MLSLSVVAALAAAGWWWATWPERTAREFIKLINTEKLTEANRLLSDDSSPLEGTLRPRAAEEDERGEPWTLERAPRSPWDILICRQEFKKPTRSSARLKLVRNARAWSLITTVDPAGTLIVERGVVRTQWIQMTPSEVDQLLQSQKGNLRVVYEDDQEE
jgi:hypothetical protein